MTALRFAVSADVSFHAEGPEGTRITRLPRTKLRSVVRNISCRRDPPLPSSSHPQRIKLSPAQQVLCCRSSRRGIQRHEGEFNQYLIIKSRKGFFPAHSTASPRGAIPRTATPRAPRERQHL